MDPVTVYGQVVIAVCTMITAIVEGQTPEQKAQVWAWFLEDQARLRKFFKIDTPAS